MVKPRVVGVGCDVQSVDAVRRAWLRHGPRYLSAVLAPSERTCSPVSAEELTERFALKEAVAKALAVRADEPFPWSCIAVHRTVREAAAVHGVPARAHQWWVDVDGGALLSAQRQGVDQWRAWSWCSRGSVTAVGYATVVALAGAKS